MNYAVLHSAGGDPFLLDCQDQAAISAHTWYRDGAYFKTRVDGRWVYLHRLVTSAARGEIVDHIDGNTADNRRANLRLCSRADNARNKGVQRNNRLGVKGVCTTSNGKFRATIQHAGRWEHIGRFDTVEEASAAYLSRAAQLHGEFARRAA